MRAQALKTGVALLSGIVVAAGGFIAMRLATAPVDVPVPVEVEVARGESPRSVLQRLADKRIIRSPTVVRVLARLRGADREFRYGVHTFHGRLTPRDVIDELLRTPTPTIRVTIPEGSTWADIAALLEREGIVASDAYAEAVCDTALLERLPVGDGANCAEGFLFPDTYNLAPKMSAAEIVDLQVRRFTAVLDALLAQVEIARDSPLLPDSARADEIDWRNAPQLRSEIVQRVVILASIIEKEARLAEERPVIASVFTNRLRRGIRLQADPTVIYGLHAAGVSWDGKGLHRHVRKPGPYNTYTNPGLPPGPICNPGRESLLAALAPAKTSYLYFVAKGDGSHAFSKTLAEHNRAVAQLRRR